MVKEKWSSDPNGNNWAKDNTKFGQKLLESMGWREGQGLGVNGTGMKTHVKVKKRSQNLGLGADQTTPDRWSEHITEFDDILGKLNSIKNKSNKGSGEEKNVEENLSEVISINRSRKRKKATNMYSKFKKHKDLSCLSNKELAHIFGEKASSEEETNTRTSANCVETDGKPADADESSGVITIKSSISMEEYFNSKKESRSLLSLDTVSRTS